MSEGRANVFDMYDPENGAAIVVKVINTLDHGYLSEPEKIYRELVICIDGAAECRFLTLESETIEVKFRTIHLRIPYVTAWELRQPFYRAISYGRSRNVWLMITRIHEGEIPPLPASGRWLRPPSRRPPGAWAGGRRGALEAWFSGSQGPAALFAGRVPAFDAPAALIWARLMAEGAARGRPRGGHGR